MVILKRVQHIGTTHDAVHNGINSTW